VAIEQLVTQEFN